MINSWTSVSRRQIAHICYFMSGAVSPVNREALRTRIQIAGKESSAAARKLLNRRRLYYRSSNSAKIWKIGFGRIICTFLGTKIYLNIPISSKICNYILQIIYSLQIYLILHYSFQFYVADLWPYTTDISQPGV